MTLELTHVQLRVGAGTHIYQTDLKLEEGRFNILLGTTLAGKTSLMRLMAGLEKPTAGRLYFNGRDVTGVPVQKRSVAFVYQQFINYPNFTVYDNIASPLRVQGKSRAQIDTAVKEVAEMLKLTPMLRRRPAELSGGQQQRIALARALVKRAELVLLDEPLANLDYKLREELREELPRLFANQGATVVYATSEPTEALLLGGYTAAMHEGRVVEYGETARLYRNPGSMLAASVFSDPPINFIAVRRETDSIVIDGHGFPAVGVFACLGCGDYIAGLRPHHLTLTPPSGDALELSGEVRVAEITGSESVIHARVHGVDWVSQNHGIHVVKPGDKVVLFMQAEKAMVFDPDGKRIS
ncbi:ABC transporter ATP-binding protein [Granulosicoccaceae sp. 1_MG-2023]|nr:ABC transporter ATP-binding protein [Granulosicoccaceae sp. 1_MG-2023]